jgi:outer membrane protein
MKKILLAILVLFSVTSTLTAQKFAYVDTQYILENLPEYKSAQQQLDRISIQWQKEIEVKFGEIDKMYKDFQAESILLTDDMKKKREDEIIDREKAAKELRYTTVFIFPFWSEIFKNDDVRHETPEEAEKIYNYLHEVPTGIGKTR